jgi:hypothetical protein
MIVTLDTARLRTIEQVEAFMQGTLEIGFSPSPPLLNAIAGLLAPSTVCLPRTQPRPAGTAAPLHCACAGYSRAQLSRLIAQHRDHQRLNDQRGPPTVPFATRYGAAALACLIAIDRTHGTLSGPATKKQAERAVNVHGKIKFAALAAISVSHLYNLRSRSRICITCAKAWAM